MVKIFTCMGRDVVTYIVKPRTTTSMSPSSVVDTVERTTTPGRGATGAATANPLPASMATVIITAYLTAFSFTLQSYKKSVNRRLYRPIKISVRHQWCMGANFGCSWRSRYSAADSCKIKSRGSAASRLCCPCVWE